MITEIYVQGKTKNPAVMKKAHARWCIRCVLNNGKVERRDGEITLDNVTTKRAVLKALFVALERFERAAVIKIYISDDFVRAALINDWLSWWKDNNWHKIRLNGEIRHLDLWQQVSKRLVNHAVTFAQGDELDNKILKEMEWRMNHVR